MAIPVSELQKINPSSIIELFELELSTALHGVNTVYRFHAGSNMDANGELVWKGNTYQRFPVEAEGFEYTGNGQLPRPKIRVSNLLGTITGILLTVNATTAGNDLNGAKLTRIRTLARYIDDANFDGGSNPYGTPDTTAEFPQEIYYLDRKVTENRDVVEWELAAAFDLAGVRAPKRQCINNLCQWVYRGAECGYTGAPIADENDVLLEGVTDSAEAIAYYAAKEAFEATEQPLADAQATLNSASNTLNSASGTWYLAETRYSKGIGSNYYVRGPRYTTLGLGSGTYEGVWNGSTVSLGDTYRRGKLRATDATNRYGSGSYSWFEIERWYYDTSAVSSAQSSYDSALSAYNTAKSNYDSAKTALDTAFDDWKTSPPYQGQLDAIGDVCGKRLSSCKLRFGELAELPFGAFPGIGTFFT
jgi:lambda family phage minor tail protein L